MKKLSSIVLAALVVVLGVAAVCDAAIITNVVGGTSGLPARDSGRMYVLQNSYDCSANNRSSSDVVQMITVPAGCHVLNVAYFITTGEDGTCTVDIGDGADTDGYFDGANVETGQTADVISSFSLATTDANYATNVATTTANFGTAVSFDTLTLTNMAMHGSAASVDVVTNVTLTTSAAVTAVTAQTGAVSTGTAATGYTAGKLYTSADTIDVLFNNDADALVLTIRALVVEVESPE